MNGTDTEGELLTRQIVREDGPEETEFHTMLVASTRYITVEDRDKLEGKSESLVYFAKGEYGWFINIPEGTELEELMDRLVNHGFSAAFVNLIQFTVDNKCQWLMLDRDGGNLPGLPTFKW